jgi:solute carrier family 45, member 1/2/4
VGNCDPKQRHRVWSHDYSRQPPYILTRKQAPNFAIGLAVVSFYVLDFALNALQASLRNLLLDITPPEQLSAGNAWHSRMTQGGNIVGYGFGFLPLASLPIIRLLGGDQFRKFCILVMIVLVITVWITCYTQAEEERILQRPSEGYVISVSEVSPVFDGLQDIPGNLEQYLHRCRSAS